ncbi:MAG: hypothetical protein ACTS85_01960 [Arsenophonus sp. NC-PG7-MAG3]
MYHEPCFVVYKTANVLASSSKVCTRKLKQLSEIWLLEIPDATNNIIDVFIGKIISINISAAIKKLKEEQEELPGIL